MWQMVLEWEDLKQYFPDYDPPQFPEREFLFGVLSTLRENEMRQLVKEARDNRAIVNNENEDGLIEILPEIKEEIMSILPHKSKHHKNNELSFSNKGKGLSASQERYKTEAKKKSNQEIWCQSASFKEGKWGRKERWSIILFFQ